MDLTSLRVNLRPRTAWEGIDLGFVLARHWFLPLWLLWLVGALPVFLLLNLLLPIEAWLAGLLAWWFKPLYEPPLVFWLGRAVFADPPNTSELRRRWWRLVWPQLFANLTWRRLNSTRSFDMPVTVLEGLRGKPRSLRIRVLGRGQHAASWLTFIGIHFEVILELGLLILLVMLVPEELLWFDLGSYLFEPVGWQQWLQQITGLLAMSVIAPFYVAAGFGLYLTRRAQLEAWDVELGLRQLAERFRQRHLIGMLLAGLIGGGLSGLLPTQSVEAGQLRREESKVLIQEVMAEDDFGQRETLTYWKYVGELGETSDQELPWLLKWLIEVFQGFLEGFARFGEILLWLAGGALLAYLVLWFMRNRGLLDRSDPMQQGSSPLPMTLAGLDIRPESLPLDIVAQARQDFARGEIRTGLSLLYRGALSTLVHRDHLVIPVSATEGECLGLAGQVQRTERQAFLQRLTRVWQAQAYAHRAPDPQLLEELCQGWGEAYGE
ncbi:MAG: DUF4129 domain-containing protein [Chromatiales bacterium]|jgi:hypothetical protein